MTDECRVCDGRRWIRLPFRRDVSAVQFDPTPAQAVGDSSRQYDCPECVKKIRYECVGAMKAKRFMDPIMSPASEAWWRDNAARAMASRIGDMLITSGFIKFDTLPADDYHAEGIIATLRAVLPGDMVEFDQRVTSEAVEIADEVAEEAIKLIDNWNSYYCHPEILKSDARREIRDAARTVKKKRGKR